MDIRHSTQTPTIGQLCFGGDWACTQGDSETLGYIALQLAETVNEPLHCELVALAELCAHDPDRATAAWFELKERIQGAREGAAPKPRPPD